MKVNKRSKLFLIALITFFIVISNTFVFAKISEIKKVDQKQLSEAKKQEKAKLFAMDKQRADKKKKRLEKMQSATKRSGQKRMQEARKRGKAQSLVVNKQRAGKKKQLEKMRSATKRAGQKRMQEAKKQEKARLLAMNKQWLVEKKQRKSEKLVMNKQRAADEKRIKIESNQIKKIEHASEKAARRASWEEKRDRVKARRAEHAKQREQEDPRWAFLYKVPSWDFPALPFKKSDLVCVTGRYQYAGKSYSSSDHTQDITKLVFGEAPIRVQDILLVSKLVRGGKLWPLVNNLAGAQAHYLYVLANEQISFDGEMEEWRGSFDFARHFTKELSFGFQIPFASRRHELKLQTNLSETAKAAISGDAADFAFPAKYNHSFTAFIEDILAEKNIKLHPKNTNTGIGDITTFVNWDIPTKHVEKLMFGVKVLFPTARDRDLHKLWDAELGNGGFTELSPYCAFIYAHNKFFNPHFYGQITYGVPACVDRRVPRLRTYDGSAAGNQTLSNLTSPAGIEGIVFANRVKTIPPNAEAGHSVSFNEVDTTFRRFSTETLRIKIHPGPEINFRIGNMLEKVFVKRMFADFYYNFYAKGKDHVGAKLDTTKWDGTVLKKNSYKVAHKFGVNLSYQFDKNVRAELGGKYTFIGRNVPEIWEANGAVRLDF